ncbi:lysozyme [Caballeronia sp. LP006]|uniref:lysozyme n=1 Tax=Caballeronia sp. LP006 TaxID=3038552 RepID=UPI00286728E2|nr:lysozyme [Caballeronia sp. LP006]MDR5830108.1 lysozyme [Caballeronia sp. LP006]
MQVIHWGSRVLGTCLVAILFLQSASSRAQFFVPRSQVEDFGAPLGAAPLSPPPPISPLGIGLIKDFEGWQPIAYDDPAGYCTIGYGHLIAKQKCSQVSLEDEFRGTWSLDKGNDRLEIDTRTSRAAVQRLVTRELEDYQFSALSSFVFNVGKENFAGSTLLQLINDGDLQIARNEFAKWVMSKGRVYKGLQDRRACEAALFSNGLEGRQGKFERVECVSLGAAPSTQSLIDIDVGEKK